jgi:Post-segregation antitoxin CcdA
MRMARVNITVPDDLLTRARSVGLNISQLAQHAIAVELDRRTKIDELDAYLRELESQLGPIPPAERRAAEQWADKIDELSRDERSA